MLTLPEGLRDAFREPLGPVYTDAEVLLARVDEARTTHDAPDAPIVAVGDVVSYHLREAGCEPDVSLVDGRTEREAVDPEIRSTLAGAGDRRVSVENPAGKLSSELFAALRDALDAGDSVVIDVVGEEDLAALPAIAAAPAGSSVVYGQPGEGMVHVVVTGDTAAEARALLRQFDGDVDAALAVLDR